MEPSTKKRSIFGLGSLFQRSTTPSEQESKKDTAMKDAAPSLPRPASASAPESPAKRASESQMATRKIIGRPHGPSSKLSQSFTASDLTRTVTIGNPRRMPGDNPNKPSSFSTAMVTRPNTNFTGQSSTRTNIFRSTARPGLPNYSSPRPPSSLNQSFPPNTPGRATRAATAELNGRALPQPSTSGDLFKMRIQSPPLHLTGEMLAKEVPSELNRTGSVYADEFLAHYCPPDLDEQQRRQFFCILDLRRLKYAADEVFTKKDWKINILNFAKEYEKSRSLIMLRYGLYEFKTVRASEAVRKEWKEKHNIPDSDGEEEAAPKTNGGAKRKASVELTPHSGARAGPVQSSNQRTRAPEVSAKNKRKADEEPDESFQPAKLQKPGPLPSKAPSATKSLFESVANNTPVKAFKPSSLFESSTKSKPNGLFASSSKPASNIFGHLSDASKNSGNEGADEDSDSESEAEEEDTEEASGSEDQTSSGEGSSSDKKASVNGASGSSSDAGESFSQGRSLFERITRGADGKPVRKLDTHDGSLFPTPAEKERAVSPVKEAAAPAPKPAPANQTWNVNTPIKFSAPAPAPGTSLFGSTAPKPAASGGNLFGSAKSEETPRETPKETPAPTNLFGGAAKKTEESTDTSKPPANLFSGFQPNPVDSTPAATPAFGGFTPSAPTSTGSSLFGSSTAAPAAAESKKEEKKAATVPGLPTAAPTSFSFGGKDISVAADNKTASFKPADMFGENKKDIAPAPPLNLFGQAKKEDTPAASTPPASSLFGASTAAKPAETKSLFGASTAGPAAETKNLFGASTTASSTEEPAAKKFAFGSTDTKSTTSSLFGSNASTPVPEAPKPTETKSLFGASTTAPATETKSLFGASTTTPGASLFGNTTQPAAAGKPLFGASTTAAPATETKSLFGSTTTATTPVPESKPLFGSTTPAPETKSLFGSTTPAPGTKSLFGSTTPAAENKTFQFGGTPAPEAKPMFGNTTTATETKSLFGTTSAPETKPFFGGNTIQPESKPPASLFASSQTPAPSAPPASNIFSFGGTQTTVPANQSFNFGATPASQPAAPAGGSIFGNAGAGASTSFNFTAGGGNSANNSFNNPFSSGQDGPPTAPTSFNFGSGAPPTTQSFTFGSNTPAPSAGGVPTFSFGGASDAGASQTVPSSGPVFSFGGASQNPAGGSIFANSLAPGGGTSTGTNTPFTFGGASSLATTPAAGTPEPSASGNNTAAAAATAITAENGNTQGTNADGDEAPQEQQISLTDGGRGEEDESVVHEVRAKAQKYLTGEADDDSSTDNNNNKKKGWAVQGIGNLKLLKHKETGVVRLLLRAEPRGHVALNTLLQPSVTYKVDPPGAKALKFMVAKENGKGLEVWMLQVKTKEMAEELAKKMEEEKKGNEKNKE
ncbi:hypothetical protein QBC40DRAFT_40318 [Triangularia verruculosa]|uniref:RanBD1 domain-containing protein n=1 Tax=Triangularia verruculosa TaxID=2587418 RepID=A0AAN6X791_9PEZI|nr:hypothetical protein QBC40DRAFT_40318 [Triangularia verruculosa]